VTQVGDDIHVMLPRALPVKVKAEPADEHAAANAAANAANAAAQPAAPPAPAGHAPEAAPAAADHDPSAAAATAPATNPAPEAAAPDSARPLGARPPRPASGRWMLLLGGLAVVALAIVGILRRRKHPTAITSRIEVIDSRSIGGKSRVVWLSAGEREFMIAVTPQSARVLGTWRRGEVPTGQRAEDEEAADGLGLGGHDELPLPPPPRSQPTQPLHSLPRRGYPRTGTSPAVDGILRLRGNRTSPDQVDDFASGDTGADEQWARDILAATGGRR
jgi:flagellar biogenesis protein FliO